MKLALAALFALLWATNAVAQPAEQLARDGNYIVHYAALSTTTLTPDIARQYGVQRSANRGLLLLNPQRETSPGKTIPVAAHAEGSARSLTGHEQTLNFREVLESGVHNLLVEFQVLDGEFLQFDLEVLPEGAPRPIRLKFSQQFYAD